MPNQYVHVSVDWLKAGMLALASPFILAGGYFLSACFLLAALHKPFAPARVGLWQLGDEFSLHLGFGTGPLPTTGIELLGWWLVPAGILLGSAGVLTMNKLATAVLYWERRFWSTHFKATGLIEPVSAWIRLNWTACIEIGLVGGVLVADRMHLVPVSNTPFLLALAWISLRMRHLTWRDVGLVRPDSWTQAIAVGIVAGLALECFSLLATEPLIGWVTGVSPDRSDMRPVVGSPVMLGVALALNWTLAAFGEEMVWRGYLLNRIMGLGFRGTLGPLLCLFLTSALFGIAHGESQGLAGMLQESFAGLALGSLYFAFGRRLAIPVIAHGASNSLALIMIFFNRYPGL
jgi:membrane protease YdiL (CAAX protease family)